MAEIRTVTTLRNKRLEILRSIALYEERLDQARADLAHIGAAITIFEGAGAEAAQRPYVDVYRAFKRHELIDLCKAAMADGPKDTRELAQAILTAKGLDAGDKVLCKAVAFKIIHSLRQQVRRGKIADAGKRGNVRMWALPERQLL